MDAVRENASVRAEETRTQERLARQPGPAQSMTLMAAAFGLSRGRRQDEDD